MSADLAKPVQAVTEASDGAVELRTDGPIALLQLNRPQQLNAINSAVLRGLTAAVEYLDRETAIRVAVIHGAGRGFCAGADLGEVGAIVADQAAFGAFLTTWHGTLAAVEMCRVPTIGALHGFAMAGGFELAQVCDFVVVGDQTRIADQHANFGLFPAGGSTQRLSRMIGYRQAAWLLMSGASLSPEHALSSGFANQVAPEAAVLEAAMQMAQTLAAKSAGGTQAIKKAMLIGADLDVTAALRRERPIALAHMASDDVRKGLDAFRARATPDFTDPIAQ